MKRSFVAVIAALTLSLAGPAMAQSDASTTTKQPATESEATTAETPVSCAEILATPSASADEIAALNDTSVVTVLRCQDADADAAARDATIADLRSAAAANPTLAPRFTAAGAAPDQVVAFRRGDNGEFAFYVIGAYR